MIKYYASLQYIKSEKLEIFIFIAKINVSEILLLVSCTTALCEYLKYEIKNNNNNGFMVMPQ